MSQSLLRKRPSTFSDPQVRKHRPDYKLLTLSLVLLGIGLIVIYAISPALAAQGGNVSNSYFVGRQSIAIVLGLLAFYGAYKIPISIWDKWQKPLIILAFLLSLSTIFLGGLSNRWIQLGVFSFQPVEFVKFVLLICLASFLALAASRGKLSSVKYFRTLIIIFLIFAVVIIGFQRDLGSAFVLICMSGAMLFIAGIPMKKMLIFAGIALIGVTIAISMTAYRRDRFMTFLQPERDCVNSGYHVCQAMIAVGSGGVLGVGLGHSVQEYGYLPEAANDSIFAIYAEKFGFVGVIILIGLIGLLLTRILEIMRRAPNRNFQLICAGVFAWLAVQAVVNIGAMIGLLPLKGITLPFISYGGTSLIFVMAALGLVFQVSSYTSMRKSNKTSFDDDDIGGDDEGASHRRRDSRARYSVTRGRS